MSYLARNEKNYGYGKESRKKVKEIAEFIGVNGKTVWKWNKRACHPERKF